EHRQRLDIGQPLVYRMFAADRRTDQHALYTAEYLPPAPARLLGLQRRGQHSPALATERSHVAPIAHVLIAWVASLDQLLLAQIGLDFVRLGRGCDRLLSVDRWAFLRRRWRLHSATALRLGRYFSLIAVPRHYPTGMASTDASVGTNRTGACFV